jgi:bifunctional non-homologous end joining protein LigD
MPDETIIDAGRPSFNTLQSLASSKTPILYYVFDIMMLEGVDVTGEALSRRRTLLEEAVLPKMSEPIKYSSELDSELSDLIALIKKLGLEGLIAKRKNSCYESGFTFRRVEENASQLRTRIRHRRIHGGQSF